MRITAQVRQQPVMTQRKSTTAERATQWKTATVCQERTATTNATQRRLATARENLATAGRATRQLMMTCILYALVPFSATTQPSVTKIVQNGIQLFMPKTVYVGDTAELRYMFYAEQDLLSVQPSAAEDAVALSVANASTAAEASRVNPAFTATSATPAALALDAAVVASALMPDGGIFVKTAALERVADDYALVITLIPWRAGTLVFAPLDVAALVGASRGTAGAGASVLVQLAPVTVCSLVSALHETELRPPQAPLLLPGTTALLLSLAVLAVVVLTMLIVLLRKLPALSALLAATGANRLVRRHASLAIKRLRRAERLASCGELEMRAFCGEMQHILRDFLEKRFSRPFATVVTPSLYDAFVALAGGSLSEPQEQTVQTLVALFARTDYLRFAREAQGLTDESATLLVGEASDCVRALSADASAQGGRHARL